MTLGARIRSSLFVVALLSVGGLAVAQTPLDGVFTYQGRLKDQGEPANGSYGMQFRLCGVDLGGVPLATYPPGGPLAVTVTDGLFTTLLDFGTLPFVGERRWLEVVVDGVTLAPRQELTAVPYATWAAAPWVPGAAGVLCYTGGDVGVGTVTPSAKLHVYSTAAYSYGLLSERAGQGGTAVFGYHVGIGIGAMGQSAGSGTGVLGVSNTGTGVIGSSQTSGTIGRLGDPQYGVYGENSSGDAGYFAGNVHVTGNLLVDGSFAVDAWGLSGNAGTDPNVNFLGTTDNRALTFRTDNVRGLELRDVTQNVELFPGYSCSYRSVNVLGGSPTNSIAPGVSVATVSGGGCTVNGDSPWPNSVSGLGGTVGGGASNRASGHEWATVAGGLGNVASGSTGTVSGGLMNAASGDFAVVAGGSENEARGTGAVVPGGHANVAGGPYSFAAGYRARGRDPNEAGDANGDEGTFIWADASDPNDYFMSTGPNQFRVRATGGVDFVVDADPNAGGGLRVEPTTEPNSAYGRTPNIVGGSALNEVSTGVVGGTIGGGGGKGYYPDPNYPYRNRVTDDFGTVGGGLGNRAGDDTGTSTDARFATVGGGRWNNATGNESMVGGGYYNYATGDYSTVGGGYANNAAGTGGTIGGGASNRATGYASTVGGGASNNATGHESMVGGGASNNATGPYDTVCGGLDNDAAGDCSTVPGGRWNRAGAGYSLAAGRGARVRDRNEAGDPNGSGDHGTFVWADYDTYGTHFVSTGPNQFLIRATGGVGIGTNAPSNQLTVDGDADFTGNVGIGTASPRSTLDVRGPSGAEMGISVERGTDQHGGISWYETGTRQWIFPFFRGWQSDNLIVRDEAGIKDTMTFQALTGNVGIGVSDPSEKLDINGTARLRGIGTGTGTAVVADANGKLWKQSSSRRYKHDVADLPANENAALNLRPVSFAWNSTCERDIGLIAEEVADVLPDLVLRDADGQPEGVKYDKVALYLLEVVTAQREQIAVQRDELAELRMRLDKIEAALGGSLAPRKGDSR